MPRRAPTTSRAPGTAAASASSRWARRSSLVREARLRGSNTVQARHHQNANRPLRDEGLKPATNERRAAPGGAASTARGRVTPLASRGTHGVVAAREPTGRPPPSDSRGSPRARGGREPCRGSHGPATCDCRSTLRARLPVRSRRTTRGPPRPGRSRAGESAPRGRGALPGGGEACREARRCARLAPAPLTDRLPGQDVALRSGSSDLPGGAGGRGEVDQDLGIPVPTSSSDALRAALRARSTLPRTGEPLEPTDAEGEPAQGRLRAGPTRVALAGRYARGKVGEPPPVTGLDLRYLSLRGDLEDHDGTPGVDLLALIR